MLDPRNPVALTQALVRCPSVTPNEGGALQLLADVLGQAGFETHLLTFSEPGTPDVQNLYARIGTDAPYLLFAGHTDVVPPGDESRWTHPPFGGDIVDGVLYGRGATDMKSGVAASVSATLRWLEENGGKPPRGSVGFLITGDEEGPAVNGTVKLLEWAQARGERFDCCVLGEPTNPEALGDMIKIGRRGSLTGRLTVEGVQGHVAYQDLAENPIRGMVRLLEALMAKPLDGGTEQFGPSNLEVTTVDVGNPASNVIPASAKAVFNIRFNDLWTAETLADELRRRLAEAAGNSVRFYVVFEPSNAPAFLTPPGPFVSLVSEAVESVTGRKPVLSTTGGTSDARFIKSYCPVIEFGLVGKTMHKVDENAATADIEALTGIYGAIIRRAVG
ncbi:succinyl-diaminopimelate desuccinylase [Alsobacter soli]|uniref:Succinyl-diaminopimelate desuccinylase n=1 Tax=Alsobacter soli TaxID=2109933 RepID=A0A2T1HXF0_9HYPH|nr:succinyl-diaminopimelate desuccinylase [Alsobacter soli]PSC06270.1 succinyl-diaminopimelate desuccinylase [Alsobacter soli]